MALVELERQRRAYADVKKRLWGQPPVAVRPAPKPASEPPKPKWVVPPILDDEYVAMMTPREPRPIDATGFPPTIENIKRHVCYQTGVSKADMESQRRLAKFSRARQIVMYFARRLTKHPFAIIGQRLGGRDHTTVLHGVRLIEQKIKTDPLLAYDVAHIEVALGCDGRQTDAPPPIAELPRADTSDPPFLPPV
jgi:hypothetical protein